MSSSVHQSNNHTLYSYNSIFGTFSRSQYCNLEEWRCPCSHELKCEVRGADRWVQLTTRTRERERERERERVPRLVCPIAPEIWEYFHYYVCVLCGAVSIRFVGYYLTSIVREGCVKWQFNSVYFIQPRITNYKFASGGFTICTHTTSLTFDLTSNQEQLPRNRK